MGIAEQVAEPVGVAHVAAEQRLQRIALEARLVAVLEQLEQAVVRALLRGGVPACTGAARQRRSSEAERIRRPANFIGYLEKFGVSANAEEAPRLDRNASSINER